MRPLATASENARFDLFTVLLLFQEEKKSLKEKLQTVQEVTAMIQHILGEVASYLERVKK